MEQIRADQEGADRGTPRVNAQAATLRESGGSPPDPISDPALSPLFTFFGLLALASTETDVFEAIIGSGVAALGATSAALALLRDDAPNLRLVAASGHSTDELARVPEIPLSAPVPLARVVESGVPLWFPRPNALVRRFPAVAAEAIGATCSLAYLPLKDDEQTIGVLVLRYAEEHTFEQDERDQLLMTVDLCGTALRLARTLESARIAEEQHADALAIVAHELRNPLTSIRGHLQLLAQHLEHDPIDRQRADASIRQVLSQTARLEQLLTSMLDRSRIQRGLLELEIVPSDLCVIVRTTAERFAASPEWTPNHRLELNLPDELPGAWDPLRIEQVVTNLLSNAVKYSPSGGRIAVTARALGDLVELTVADEGIGIPSEERANLFEPFRRSGGPGLQVPGSGLGLHVVATIVERHQGVVAVESEPGSGTTITILLPRSPLDSPLI